MRREHVPWFALTALIIAFPLAGSASVVFDHSNSSTLTSGLVGYWPLDGNTTSFKTNTTQDVSGNGNTGTLVSMSTTTSPVVGKIGQALKFNGSNNAIKTAANFTNISGVSIMTLSFWIKWNAFANNDALAFEYSANANNN